MLQLIFSSLCFAYKLPGYILACTALTSFCLAALHPQKSHSCHSCSGRGVASITSELLLPCSPFPNQLCIYQSEYTYYYLIFSLFRALFELWCFSHLVPQNQAGWTRQPQKQRSIKKKEGSRKVLRDIGSDWKKKKPEPFLLIGAPPVWAALYLLSPPSLCAALGSPPVSLVTFTVYSHNMLEPWGLSVTTWKP